MISLACARGMVAIEADCLCAVNGKVERRWGRRSGVFTVITLPASDGRGQWGKALNITR